MSQLESTLRALLWKPQDTAVRLREALPGHVRRKEYRLAADCQEAIAKAEREIELWENLLKLYLSEHPPEQTLAENLCHVTSSLPLA